MHAVELGLLEEELEPFHVPGDMAGVRLDLQVRHGAMNPFFCSSKSRWSANGSVPRASLSTSRVYFEGALPLGSKCPGGAAPDWARAEPE